MSKRHPVRMSAKPRCSLSETDLDSGLAIPYRVRQALLTAGLDERAKEFLDRATRCNSVDQLLRLARQYVDVVGERAD